MRTRIRGKSFLAGVLPILAISVLAAFAGVFFEPSLTANAAASKAAEKSASVLRHEPWSENQTVTPTELAKEISHEKGRNRPIVVCAGFRTLYEGAHVAGAVFHGPASKPEGLASLKKWARRIPRSANVVVYCGCCPFEKCPNVRPAFKALRTMGFQHLRVLVIPNDFYKDWYAKGYPVEKGK